MVGRDGSLTPEQQRRAEAFERAIESLLVKERRQWTLNLGKLLNDLKAMKLGGVTALGPDDANNYRDSWHRLVENENTRKAAELTETLGSMYTLLQKIPNVSIFPHWVMDRFKEALDQHVRGEWVSSIILSGAIVEFVATQFMEAFKESIPPRDRSPRQLKTSLLTLKAYGMLADDDYERLDEVRAIRNRYVHPTKLRDTRTLREDNLRALAMLCEFLDLENISPSPRITNATCLMQHGCSERKWASKRSKPTPLLWHVL